MRLVFLSAIACAAVATAGCGDGKGSTGTGGVGGGGGSGGSGANCAGHATGCGGDLVGTWAITQACGLTIGTPPPAICPQIDFAGSTLTETGTVTFTSGGAASEVLMAIGTLSELVPPDCLDGALGTCADLDANFQMAVQDGSYTSASCTGAASGSCQCTASFNLTTTVSGTYTTSGVTVTVTKADGSSSTASYCVQGSTLVLIPTSTTGAPPATYVLTRQ